MKKIFYSSLLLIIFLSGCSKIIITNGSKNSPDTNIVRTGYKNNNAQYGGQDCVMYEKELYWIEKEIILSDEYKQVGIIKECVDKVPTEEFTSAKADKGSKVYIKNGDKNTIYIEMKEQKKVYSYIKH